VINLAIFLDLIQAAYLYSLQAREGLQNKGADIKTPAPIENEQETPDIVALGVLDGLHGCFQRRVVPAMIKAGAHEAQRIMNEIGCSADISLGAYFSIKLDTEAPPPQPVE
jgi:hypothetical protein